MEPFLQSLASQLFTKFEGNLGDICIVFPNRRAGLFLQKYFAQLIVKPIWLPQMYALEDFVIYNSGMRLSDPLTLITRLYKTYKFQITENTQSFSEFVSWGNMLLSDFDEMDQYLADGEKVFTYLDEIKTLQHWNPDGSPLTTFEQKYLHFYNSLAPCYKLFSKSLIADGEGYFGLIFKELLNRENLYGSNTWEKVIFAGFNALTPAEEKLISLLYKQGKAEVYWDADKYYLDDPIQEAGSFLRKYLNNKTFGEFNWIGSSLLNDKKKIKVFGVPGNIGQAKLAGEISKQVILEKAKPGSLAMVMVDEGMLLPVLNSIPPEIGDFNVTMGFPLKQTPLYFLITSVVDLFVNAIKHQQKTISENSLNVNYRFYHKDIQRVITHPYVVSWQKYVQKKSTTTIEKSFYTFDGFTNILRSSAPDLLTIIQRNIHESIVDAAYIVRVLKALLADLFNFFTQEIPQKTKSETSFVIDAEYLHQVLEVFDKLTLLVEDSELSIEPETLQSLLNALISGIKLPFYGEPLNGMQVMGMLETRLLDFEDVILISANEGMLPKSKHQNTFVPDEVRRSFGMQRYSEKNAVFAYHFYRLLQRASNVWILYSTEGDEMGGGEKSRFVTQLLHELKYKNPNIEISEEIVAQIPANFKYQNRDVVKTDLIYNRLLEIAEKGISPTALSAYLRCNLQFYFAQVLKIGESEEITDSLDAAELGKIVHSALNTLYAEHCNGLITKEVLKRMRSVSIKYLEKAFLEKYSADELSVGRNLLIVKVAENMVSNLLAVEQEFLTKNDQQIEIILLEKWLKSSIEVEDKARGGKLSINLHGQADRIDKIGSITRIIDYKTGSFQDKELKIAELSELQTNEDPSKLLQVLIYALLYVRMNKLQDFELQSGIISLQKPSLYLSTAQINKEVILNQAIINSFEEALRVILEEVYDKNSAFKATNDKEKCSKCAYRQICNRII